MGTKRYELPEPLKDTMLWHHVVTGYEVLRLRSEGGEPAIFNDRGVELSELEIGPVHRARAKQILDAKPGKVVSLLLKVRKGKTAGFNVRDWALVCAVADFAFEVKKEDREISEVVVTTSHSQRLRIVREGRSIPFYYFEDKERRFRGGFLAWTAHVKEPLSEFAALALGLPTFEQENQLREYKARDWSNTGTCGVCEFNVKMKPDEQVLVHHGYQRPGDGSIRGDCFGVNKPPHELSPLAATGWLALLRTRLKGLKGYLEQLRAGHVKQLSTSPLSTNATMGSIERGEPGWDRALNLEIDLTRSELAKVEKDEAKFSKKVANWKLDELPEVKLKKLDEHVAAMVQRSRRSIL